MRRSALFPALAALLCAVGSHAQSNTGTIFGTLIDPQKKPIAGGIIAVRSADLAATRTITSDAGGRFGLTGLVPGAYVVEAKFNGLALRRPVRLTVALGTSTQVALQLEVARVRQGTTVTARGATSEGNTVAPPINQTEPSISSFLAGTVITYLPNRDRDITQFDQLAIHAHEDSEGTGISVAGQRSNALLTQVDGVDFISPLLGGVRGAQDRSFFLPQTTVREFQIVTSGAGAEAGRTNAGLINVATKEGSNKFHGEAFYTARPATLSSADAFGHSLDNFESTYGASFGGPLRKDRSFFYAGFEQDFLHLPTFFQFAPQASGIMIPTALSATQIPAQSQIVEHNTPLAFSMRFDQTISPRDTFNLELAANRLRISNTAPEPEAGLSRTLAAPSQTSSVSGQSFFMRAGLTSILSSRGVNQALFSWSSDHRGETPNSTAPELFINGFGVLGGNALGPHVYTSQDYQILDTVSLIRGKNLVELGGNFALAPAYEQREENLNGRFDYNSLAGYLANQPRRFQQTFMTGNTRYSGAVRELGLYANAHLELRPSLTLTAGLRWGAQWNPQPPNPNPFLAQTQRIPNDLTEWQPRLGLAWSPLAKTVVRLSSGLYTAPTPATFFHRVFADNGTQTIVADSYFDPQLLALTGAFTGTPHALAAAPTGLNTPSALVAGIAPNFRNPTSLQAAASLDQTLSPKLTLRAGYLHAGTWHLDQRLDENLNPPIFDAAGLPVFPATRPISGVGRLLIEQSSAHSSYNALDLAAIAQISRRSQFTVNYTLARTRDDDTNLGPYSIDSAQNPFNLRGEQAFSNLDQRNTLNASAIFNLPFGLKLNPLLIAHSGAPYTALIGFDTQNDADDFNDRATLNGLTTNRNQFRQPAFTDTDLRLVKDFTLKGEGHHLDLFLDAFDLFSASNRNFGPEQVSLYGNNGSPVYSAGQALFAPGASRIGGPREIQFTARLVAF